jgi:uncharacterized protein YndB with AHSA1/START domain
MAVEHGTFVLKHAYAAPLGRVFAAWADPRLKAAWFCETGGDHELDFRVGGRKVNRDGTPGGPGYTSVSLTTVTFVAAGEGTELTLTEQIAALDGHDTAAARERGTQLLLDRLDRHLSAAAERDEPLT